jgi:hypothetical protein
MDRTVIRRIPNGICTNRNRAEPSKYMFCLISEDQRDVVAVVKAEQFRSFMHTLVLPCLVERIR